MGSGPGTDDDDMLARARAMQLDAPVIRSQELVIQELVRPIYPEEARANDVEGTVEVLALVDTTGLIAQATILGGTGNPLLERAATDAVLQCRYHPYRRDGRAERVYAPFRIRFSLY
jgi:TonB family protein